MAEKLSALCNLEIELQSGEDRGFVHDRRVIANQAVVAKRRSNGSHRSHTMRTARSCRAARGRAGTMGVQFINAAFLL